MAFFRIRTVLDEWEAHLRPPPHLPRSAATGKSERKRYGTGEERLKVRARGLDVPDGTRVEIVIAGAVVAHAHAEGGRIRLDLTSRERRVPAVADGDGIEVRAAGQVLVQGTYRPE